jgi:hypothetical protein
MTFSSDDTSHWSINYNSHHANWKADTYEAGSGKNVLLAFLAFELLFFFFFFESTFYIVIVKNICTAHHQQ